MADGGHFKTRAARYFMNSRLDRIQIWCGDSPGISDNLINFWEVSIKNISMPNHANGGHLKKNICPKT